MFTGYNLTQRDAVMAVTKIS